MKSMIIACLLALLLPAFADDPGPTLDIPTGEDAPVAIAGDKGVVSAHPRLNVRSNPGERYEVVTRLADGEAITVLDTRGVWLGIQAPADAEAWVATKHLTGTVVNQDNTPLYSGPGIYFSTYRNLDKDTNVAIVRSKDNTWTKITPPTGTLAWIHSDYVKIDRPATPERPPVPTTGTTALNTTDKPAIPTAPPPADNIVFPAPVANAPTTRIGIAEPAQRVGFVIPLGSEQGPWTYAIAQRVNDTYYPVAYLDKSYPGLKDWAWQRVIVTGRNEWLEGWPRPRLHIDKLEAAGTASD